MQRAPNPHFTVIIASNQGDTPYRFDIPMSWLKALGFLGFCAFLFFADIAVDYFTLLPRAHEHEILKEENQTLTNSKLVLEKRLFSLSSDLDRVHNLTTKLRRISKLGEDNQVMATIDDGNSRGPASLEPPSPSVLESI